MTWLSAKEFAERAGVPNNNLAYYRNRLGLPFKHVGGRVFYEESGIKPLIEFRNNSKKVGIINKRKERLTHCPYCNVELVMLGDGEKRCPECDKYFKGHKEITYTSNGDIIFLRSVKNGKSL